MNSIGEQIRALREGQKMSQQVFARQLGISRGFVSEIESGKKPPSQTLLMLMEARFGVSLRDDAMMSVAGVTEIKIPYDALPQRTRTLLDGVIEVMHSESSIEKDALAANIEAFVQSVRLRKKVGVEGTKVPLKKSNAKNGEM